MAGNTVAISLLNACRDAVPVPAPDCVSIGAIQPRSSFIALFAGWNSMSARPGTSFINKWLPCFLLNLGTILYSPSGMQEICGRLLCHGSSMVKQMNSPLMFKIPFVPLGWYVRLMIICMVIRLKMLDWRHKILCWRFTFFANPVMFQCFCLLAGGLLCCNAADFFPFEKKRFKTKDCKLDFFIFCLW